MTCLGRYALQFTNHCVSSRLQETKRDPPNRYHGKIKTTENFSDLFESGTMRDLVFVLADSNGAIASVACKVYFDGFSSRDIFFPDFLQLDRLACDLQDHATDFRKAADMIEEQLKYRNRVWMKSV